MERLRRARVYLRSGRMIRNLLACMGLTFGIELIILGHIPQLNGVAASLARLFTLPVEIHGAVLAFVSLALAYASAQRCRGMIATLLIANVSFYSCVAAAAFFAAHVGVFIVCSATAGVSTWQVIAVMWGGSAHVVGGTHHYPGGSRVYDRGGGDRTVRDARN